MPRKGRSTEEIVHALHQVEGGEKVAEVGRRLGVGEQTIATSFTDRPKNALKPRARCTLAEWPQSTYRLSQRRAAS